MRLVISMETALFIVFTIVCAAGVPVSLTRGATDNKTPAGKPEGSGGEL